MSKKSKIAIIGAGVSGLVAAINLEKHGYSPIVYEASDRVGGRVKTDYIDGIAYDHGFQVLLTDYPAAKKYLNYDLLDLRYFKPGSVIFHQNSKDKIGDPLRDWSLLLPTIFSKIGSFSDKIKILKLRNSIQAKSLDDIFRAPEKTTLAYLEDFGFSNQVIQRFFKPFFTGIFLENELSTSSRKFEFVYQMFSKGYAAVPAKGIQAISNQLSAQLKNTKFHFNTQVKQVKNNSLELTTGEFKEYDYVLIATDASKLVGNLPETQKWKKVENLYFEVENQVIDSNIIGLFSDELNTLSNNIHYAKELSKNSHLVSVSVIKKHNYSAEDFIKKIRIELEEIAQIKVIDFKKQFTINQALPIMPSVSYMLPKSETQLKERIFLAGDHLANGSLNAAMLNGESAALAIIEKIEKGSLDIGS